MSGETRLNPAVQNIRSGGETVINPALGIAAALPAGMLLPGGYEVVGRLDVPAGEADIFLCRKDGQDYAAKLYRRQIAVKGEVLAALEGVDCPYIAPMYYSGSYSGRHFEVLPPRISAGQAIWDRRTEKPHYPGDKRGAGGAP